jgi:hypothetical protein
MKQPLTILCAVLTLPAVLVLVTLLSRPAHFAPHEELALGEAPRIAWACAAIALVWCLPIGARARMAIA